MSLRDFLFTRWRAPGLPRWLRAHYGPLIWVGLACWTGYSLGWIEALARMRAVQATARTAWEPPNTVWVNESRTLVLRGDPRAVTRVAESVVVAAAVAAADDGYLTVKIQKKEAAIGRLTEQVKLLMQARELLREEPHAD